MRALVAALILIASLRIASTYRLFSDTADEANHVGAGLDLYQNHRYTVQQENPPLPRLVLAAAPYLGGMRRDMSLDFSHQLQSVFANGKYERDLALARVGNLVFFILAALGVWFLARRVLDETQALIALALFTTQPVILGYSGLATHDTAAVAGTALALLAFVQWLDEPTWKRAAVFVAAGYAVLLLSRKRNPLQLLIAPVTAFATIAAGYAFHLGPFFHGIRAIFALDREGFRSYALGLYAMHGWWWCFPLAFALKTTLALRAQPCPKHTHGRTTCRTSASASRSACTVLGPRSSEGSRAMRSVNLLRTEDRGPRTNSRSSTPVPVTARSSRPAWRSRTPCRPA